MTDSQNCSLPLENRALPVQKETAAIHGCAKLGIEEDEVVQMDLASHTELEGAVPRNAPTPRLPPEEGNQLFCRIPNPTNERPSIYGCESTGALFHFVDVCKSLFDCELALHHAFGTLKGRGGCEGY